MKPTIFSVLMLAGIAGVDAQINLAPNPSFEDYGTCPTFYSTVDVYTDTYVHDWFRPSDGSSDYMNACDVSETVGVPTSIFDIYQPARTGVAYLGFWSYLNTGNYREYVQAQLTEPMVAGGCYYVEFYVSPATKSDFSFDNWTCDCISMHIAEDRPLTGLFGLSPQINTVPGAFYTDTVGWTLISGIYIAEGGEEWITIGNFNEDDETEVFDFLDEGATPYVYMFVEDVLVTELSDLDVLNDTVVCAGETIVLSVPEGAGSYLWSTGATDPTISVTTTDTYWVEVTTECGVFTDSAYIFFSIDDVLFSDTALTLCYQELPFVIDPGTAYETQVWNTGDTTLLLEIVEGGTYILSGYASCQSYVDTFYIEVIEQLPDPSPLPDDTLICAVGWTALLEAAPGFDTYVWSTGETTAAINVTTAGTYSVEYTSTCDNYFDTVTIFEDPYFLETPDLGPDTIVCSIISEEIVLDANADLPNYLWNTGATTATIVVGEPGVYWVSATTACLERSDTIVVNTCVFIDVPNAFSPNNDGVNDLLSALCSDCDAFVSLSVYNRWGELVFESNDPYMGWDGTFEGKEQPIGSYAFVLRYNDAGANAYKKGYITLVR